MISFDVIKRFYHGTGGFKILAAILVISFFAIFPYFFISLNEKSWGSAFFPSDPSKESYNDYGAAYYIFLSVFSLGIINFVKALIIKLSLVKIGRQLHSRMVFRVLHSSVVNFLQRTPLGVILNRFSTDLNNIDNNFSEVYIQITYLIFGVIGTSSVILFGVTSFWILVPLVLYIVITFWISYLYLLAKRETSRLVLTSQSPVIGLANSSTRGGPLIRSLHLEGYFNQMMSHRIEENTKNLILNVALESWFDFRVELLQALVVKIPLYLLLALKIYLVEMNDPAAIINFLFSVVDFAPMYISLLKLRQNLEINSISFERCFSYEDILHEAGYRKLGLKKNIFENLREENLEIAQNYIQEVQTVRLFDMGAIRFKKVSAWYPTSNRRNIDRLTFEVPAGQKVGVVGRSGAGKSTFTKLLWRAMEPQVGEIQVDGVKITDLDLREYREQLNVILQKPSIFEGTIASNISSKELPLDDLRQISREMKDLGFPASKLEDGKLGYKVNISGNNLSLSEKQVICLMQSLQRRSRVVIMDEATAYVDPAMEDKFNGLIWRTFKDSTMFVIAHRIKSVLKCDRIFVFEQGKIVEDGPPDALLEDKNSLFYEMWSKGQ